MSTWGTIKATHHANSLRRSVESSDDRMARAMEAQMKDVREMQKIIDTAQITEDPDQACVDVVGGKFVLSEDVKKGIIDNGK